MTTQLILDDGRRLDVHVVGPQTGQVLVFHPGTPAAAGRMRFLEEPALARGLRVVVPSRPGYGRSTRHPGRTVVDAAADCRQVLEQLGVGSCLVAGWSGGSAPTLACAARLPQATAATVVAGGAPYPARGLDWFAGMVEGNVEGFTAALDGEPALRQVLERDRPAMLAARIDDFAASLASGVAAVDRKNLSPALVEDLLASCQAALAEGVDGWCDDVLALTGGWGLGLEEITIPTMLWHGAEDVLVPFGHGHWLAEQIPGVQAHLLDDEGHFSLVVARMGEILDELLDAG